MSDFFNKYPYTDFHELNLDWVLNKIKELGEAKYIKYDDVNTLLGADTVQEAIEKLVELSPEGLVVIDDELGETIWRNGYSFDHVQTVNNTTLKTLIDAIRHDKLVVLKRHSNSDNITYYTICSRDHNDLLVQDRIKLLNPDHETVSTLDIYAITDNENIYAEILPDISYNEGFVTPKMFGAVGDGLADDTAALLSCIDTGKPINLLGLSYKCTLTGSYSDVTIFNGELVSDHVITLTGHVDIDITLTVNNANGILLSSVNGTVKINSSHADATLLILENSSDLRIRLNASNIAKDAILMNANNHNIDIQGNISDAGDPTHPVIYVNSGNTLAGRNTDITIRDTSITNSGYTAILASGERITVMNTSVDGCADTGSGIWIHDASNANIINSKFSGANRYGIYVNKSRNIVIDNCEATGNYYSGLLLGYDSNTTPYYSGLDVHRNATVINSYIHDNNLQGVYSDIRIDGWKNVSFINCKVGTYRTVIVANTANANMSFINCTCEDSTFFAGLTDAIATCLTIADVYDTGGHKFSFNGKVPIANVTYTLAPYTPQRYVGYGSSSTLESTIHIIETLINDLKNKGIVD